MLFLLSASYDAHDQIGDYYIAIFDSYPTVEELEKIMWKYENSDYDVHAMSGYYKERSELIADRLYHYGEFKESENVGGLSFHLKEVQPNKILQRFR